MSKALSPPHLDSPQQKAERLRRLRNLANLSKKQLCEQADININTYIGYEAGRYTGLTQKGAEQIIKLVAHHGIYTTPEWLLSGIGPPPHVVLNDVPDTKSQVKQDETQQITRELASFSQYYGDVIDTQVSDDGMLPFFAIGDYVAGVSCSPQAILTLIGTHCIVHTAQDEVLVRNLRLGRKAGYFTLCCTNPATTVTEPNRYDVRLIRAARIIWHRQTYQKEMAEQNPEN